jgi:hypothetical protein
MAFSPLHLTAEARARSQPSPAGFVVYKMALGQETPTTVVFPLYHSMNVTYSSSCHFYQENKWAKPANLSKSKALSKTGDHRVEKYFHHRL